MFPEAIARASLCVMLAAPASAAIADGRRPDATRTERRSFDFSPPRPGEMLRNPASGVGTPPHLVEFAPTIPKDGGAPTFPPAAASEGPVAPARGRAQQGQAPAQPASPAPDPPSAGAEDATASQMAVAARISRQGLAGFLSPDAEGEPDAFGPALDVARRELAASLSQWEELYPSGGRITDSPVDAEVSPGRVSFRRAPERMVGPGAPR